MSIIHTLDLQTANSIAAGEVVERPASVVKELCENAIDAAATSISVEIRNGGISAITVSDNGKGMDHDDALAAFGRHATSKLRTIADLDAIGTMGFRGEALSSIAAVSRIVLRTKQTGSMEGSIVRIEGGRLTEHAVTGCPEGTTIEVDSLFYNTPARFKFLKRDATEAGYVGDAVERLALSRPDIAFRLVSNGQEILRTPGNNDLLSTVYAIYGKQAAAQCLPIVHRHESLLVSGFAGKIESARNNRTRQILHVNGRSVQSRIFSAAVDEAYRNRMMKGRHPFVLLRLEIPPNLVDVNVHPQKLEVRFWNDSEVYLAILRALKESIEQGTEIPEESIGAEDEDELPVPVPLRLEDLEPLSASAAPAAPVQAKSDENLYTDVADQPEETLSSIEPAHKVAEPATDYEPRASIWKTARIVGSVFSTYIVLEDQEDLILMDQHAAHERILFEHLLERSAQGVIPAQPLLFPVMLDVTAREAQVLETERELLESLGFRYDAFGAQSTAIRAIPGNAGEIIPDAALRAALDDLLGERPASRDEARATLFASMACKAAVKAGDRLDEKGIRSLLLELSGLKNPYQCPHGRPVLFRITRRELEKRFRRIV